MQTADAMGFTTRPLKVDLKAMSSVQTPAILHWDMNHFVVVKAVRSTSWFIGRIHRSRCQYAGEMR